MIRASAPPVACLGKVGNLANIRTNFIFLEELINMINILIAPDLFYKNAFRPLNFYFHSNFSGGLHNDFLQERVSAVQGHPRSLTLVPIESACAT